MSGIKLTTEVILILIAIVAKGQKSSEKTSKYDTSIESYTVPVKIHSDESTNSQFQTEAEKDRSTEPFKETTEIDRVATEKSNTIYTMEDKLTTETIAIINIKSLTETEHISNTVTEQASTGEIPETEHISKTVTEQASTGEIPETEHISKTVTEQASTGEIPETEHISKTVTEQASTGEIPETEHISKTVTEQASTGEIPETEHISKTVTEQASTGEIPETEHISKTVTEQASTGEIPETEHISKTVTEQASTGEIPETKHISKTVTEQASTGEIPETEHISKTVTEHASTGEIPEIEETVAQTTRKPETKTATSLESVTNVEPIQGSAITETLLRTTRFTDPDLFTENPNTSEDRTASFEELDDKMDSSEDLNYYQELLSTRRMMTHGNDQQNVILDTKMRNAEAESVEPIDSASAPVNNVNNFFRNQLGTVPVVNKQSLFPQFFPAVTRPGYFYKPEFIKSAAPLLLTKIIKPDLRTVMKPNPAAISQDPLPSDRQSIEDFNINMSDNAYPYLPLYDNEQTKSIPSQKFKTDTKSNEDFSKPQANPFNDIFAKLVEASKHPTGDVIKKYGNVPDNILNRRLIGFTQDHIGYSKEILARALQQRLVQKHVLLPYFLQ